MSESENTAVKLAMSFVRLREQIADLQKEVEELKILMESKGKKNGQKGKGEAGA